MGFNRRCFERFFFFSFFELCFSFSFFGGFGGNVFYFAGSLVVGIGWRFLYC